MTTALVLIDIQNDYFPGGKMPLEGAEAAAANARRLLTEFRGCGLPVFHVQHIMKRPNATFFLPNTEGVEIHAAVRPVPEEAVIIKHYPNSFRETALLERLKSAGADHLVIAGMMTHMCVDSTVRAAFDLGFRIKVAHDACATRHLSFGDDAIPAAQVHGAYIAALGSIFAETITTDAILMHS